MRLCFFDPPWGTTKALWDKINKETIQETSRLLDKATDLKNGTIILTTNVENYKVWRKALRHGWNFNDTKDEDHVGFFISNKPTVIFGSVGHGE